MKVKIAVAVLLGAWGVGVYHVAVRAQAQPPAQEQKTTRSVWDGVYTEEQAKRGHEAYTKNCAECHTETLQGDGFAAPLTGTTFISNWDGLTVGDLFERARISMPPDKPETVNRDTKVDIIAYVLSFNKFPAGTVELDRETEKLKQIKFEGTKPPPAKAGGLR
jgi:mono/diheme cytochrome c family protein